MDTITVTHHLRPVAIAGVHSVCFADHIEELSGEHPRRQHVGRMCLYAREVLLGRLPGPYSDDKAELFARLLAEIELEDGYAQCIIEDPVHGFVLDPRPGG